MCTLVCADKKIGVYKKMSLTDSKLKKFLNKSHDKPFELADRDSLSIRVSQKGKIAWQYRFRYNGKADRLSLGNYPAISLSQARALVPELRQCIQEGKNPKSVMGKSRQAKSKKIMTLEDLCLMWLEKVSAIEHKENTQATHATTVRKWILNEPIKKPLKEKWVKKNLNMPFDEITSQNWMDFFEWVKSEKSANMAGVVFKLLKSVITWGVKWELVSNSNLLLFKVKDVGKAPNVGERTPSLYEAAMMWLEIDKSKALPQTKICLKLIILLGARNSTVRNMKWEDLDLVNMIWTIPVPKGQKQATRRGALEGDVSSQRPERHPIPSKVRELLEEIALIYGKTGYVFKGDGDNNNKEITTHALNRFCTRMSSKLFMKHQISKIVPHDFRRMLQTTLCEIDSKWLVITERMLGHKLKGTMKHYNKADYLDEQLEAYELLWSKLKLEIEKINS